MSNESTPTSSIISQYSLSSSSKSKKSSRKSPIPFKQEWQIQEELSFSNTSYIAPLRNSNESSRFTLNSPLNNSKLSKISNISAISHSHNHANHASNHHTNNDRSLLSNFSSDFEPKSMPLRFADFESPQNNNNHQQTPHNNHNFESQQNNHHKNLESAELQQFQQQLIDKEHILLKREQDLNQIYQPLENRYKTKERSLTQFQTEQKQFETQLKHK
eukprot:UN05636